MIFHRVVIQTALLLLCAILVLLLLSSTMTKNMIIIFLWKIKSLVINGIVNRCVAFFYIDEATKCIFSCLAQGSADDIYYNAIDSLAEELFVGKEYVKIKKHNNWTPNKEFTTSVKHGKYDHISDDCKYCLKPTDSHLPERIVFGVE